MSALGMKLVRDLGRMRGQVITIALVVACGVASFVTLRSAYDSLLHSRDHYYHEYRFGDVFAHLERAPRALGESLASLPGVSRAYLRIVEPATLPLPALSRPARGVAVSLPSQGEAPLNQIYLREGREPDPAKNDELLILDAFAEANDLAPGDRVPVVIRGRLRHMLIVGLAMSPEFVMTMTPGDLSYDPKSAVVLWMSDRTLEAACNLEGGFNDVVLRLEPGASREEVVRRMDDLLSRYGGSGTKLREKQASHYMLDSEIQQLRNMATTVPFIFLSVAAFLLNVVLSRWISLERAQIATLKAVGYSDREVGLHYLTLGALIVVIGAILGVLVGAWLGRELVDLYTAEFFRFPNPRYILGVEIAATAVLVSLGAAVLGALGATRRVTRLPPAEAMRPEPPARHHRGFWEALAVFRALPPAARMVLREVQRRPLRLLLSSIGIAMAIGIVVVGRYMYDGIDHLIDVQFHRAMREDMTVLLGRSFPRRIIRQLEDVPGVLYAEGLRTLPAQAVAGQRAREVSVTSYPGDSEFRRVLDGLGREVPIPTGGALVSKTLADVLAVEVGTTIRLEPREGERTPRSVMVADLIEDSFGLNVHLGQTEFDRIFHEEGRVNTVLLGIDPDRRDLIERRLKELPWVLGISNPGRFREQFEAQSGGVMAVYTFILTLFASIIAVGVVYNNARVTLSQRARDLGSLRVLGFTRAEVASILFGELGIQVLLAIPIGLWFGHFLVQAINSTVDVEAYRLPVVISLRTYAYASLVAVGSAAVSALLVRRKVYSLDLIGVLKTRD